MAKKLFVGNLSWSTTADDLRQLFSQFGTIIDAVVIIDRQTNRSKGFGFVEFEDGQAADTAVEELAGKDFMGRDLVVNEARPPKPRM